MNLLFLILLSLGLQAAPTPTQAEAPTRKNWLIGDEDDLRNPKRVELGKGLETNKERELEIPGRRKP